MRSYGSTTISPKVTRKRSCRHITNDAISPLAEKD